MREYYEAKSIKATPYEGIRVDPLAGLELLAFLW